MSVFVALALDELLELRYHDHELSGDNFVKVAVTGSLIITSVTPLRDMFATSFSCRDDSRLAVPRV